MNSVILTTATRAASVSMIVFSIFMLLRGHNEPGGGFIGGLIAAAAFAVYAIAWDVAEARKALRVEPATLAMIGVLVAIGAGLWAILFGDAPFTGQWLFLGGGEAEIAPAPGESVKPDGLPISNILVFDIGVYLAVVGAVLAILFGLEEEI